MVVYKFGGASVKDVDGIGNLGRIVSREERDMVIVVSAFGKTTNALENVVGLWSDGDSSYRALLEDVVSSHYAVLEALGLGSTKEASILRESVATAMSYLDSNSPSLYDFDYDQIVSCGEIWSTLIIAAYLKSVGLDIGWIDIRGVLLTDDRYRDANVKWQESAGLMASAFDFNGASGYITQGFIGGNARGYTTTLGREGSDYTAALIANMLNAESVTVWKDVPGLLNADPEWMPDAALLNEISYREAVEMTFSGAKVIHPKTIKPLHNKGIPLYVRSFADITAPGTVIRGEAPSEHEVPVYVRKQNQVLISIVPDDFSFATSDNMSRIFTTLNDLGIKVNLVQASALSIDVCADYEKERLTRLIEILGGRFSVAWNESTEMLTIRHFTPEAIEKITAGRERLMVQYTRNMVRFVVR